MKFDTTHPFKNMPHSAPTPVGSRYAFPTRSKVDIQRNSSLWSYITSLFHALCTISSLTLVST